MAEETSKEPGTEDKHERKFNQEQTEMFKHSQELKDISKWDMWSEEIADIYTKLGAISEQILKYLVKYVFMPTRIVPRRIIVKILFILVILSFLTLSVLSLPPVVSWYWRHQSLQTDQQSIIMVREVKKAWLNSTTYILDITIALLIGGSIFGERLATKFKEKIETYQNAQDIILDTRQVVLESRLENSVSTITQLVKKKRLGELFLSIPKLYTESRRLYELTFGDIPKFYKEYLRFVLYSSFPGGLYGVCAFCLFFASCVLKLLVIYLDGPYGTGRLIWNGMGNLKP